MISLAKPPIVIPVTTDRAETAPKALPIRHTKRRPTGAAVRKPTRLNVADQVYPMIKI